MNMLEASRIILGHRAVGWDDKSINDLILWNKNWRRTIQIQREKGIGKYRAIKVVSWRVNFSTDAIADFEGLLAVNRETDVGKGTARCAAVLCGISIERFPRESGDSYYTLDKHPLSLAVEGVFVDMALRINRRPLPRPCRRR